MTVSVPPAYAWDWFARQRLLWREARSRIAASGGSTGARFAAVEIRGDVVPLLRASYPEDDVVRRIVHEVVIDLVFLGNTRRRFAELGIANPPRGLCWWWSALTGEDLDAAPPATLRRTSQLTLDDVLGGYGD